MEQIITCQLLPCQGLVGLAISYALSVTNLLGDVVNSFAETEKQTVSVERAQQYIEDVPNERMEGSLLVRCGKCRLNACA